MIYEVLIIFLFIFVTLHQVCQRWVHVISLCVSLCVFNVRIILSKLWNAKRGWLEQERKNGRSLHESALCGIRFNQITVRNNFRCFSLLWLRGQQKEVSVQQWIGRHIYTTKWFMDKVLYCQTDIKERCYWVPSRSGARWLNRRPNRLFRTMRCRENLSSGENRAKKREQKAILPTMMSQYGSADLGGLKKWVYSLLDPLSVM